MTRFFYLAFLDSIEDTLIMISRKNLLTLVWVISITATLGSLYFSEIAHFPPCVLCWYQRICIYPLTLICFVGLYTKDKNLPLYILPLALIGTCVALFHNLLYYQILPEAAAPCIAGISCTTKFIEWFGFVTIPLLSLLAFVAIDLLTIYCLKTPRDN